MELKTSLGVLAFSLAIIGIALMIPAEPISHEQRMPWQIEKTGEGLSTVFGLTLGRSTVADAELKLGTNAEVSLFSTNEDEFAIEVYFNNVSLAGLSAKIIIVTDLSTETLKNIYGRGERISALGDGTKKVSLSASDAPEVKAAAIASLTYLPRVSLDDELIQNRFGSPSEKITIEETQTTHWLYPNLGLDIALSNEGGAVLQYVAPKDFSQISAPLMQSTN